MITKEFMMSFLPYDYEGIEKMLMKKSSEGWQLVKAGEIFWTFQKGEPDEFKYNVTYIPDASEYRAEDTEHQMTLDEYCSNAGWERVCNYKKIHIYRNPDLMAIPIDTDEEQKLNMIHLAVKRWLLLPTWFIIGLFLGLMATLIFTFLKRNDVMSTKLASLFLFSTMMILFESITIINYYIWFYCSKKNIVNHGKCCSAKGADIVQNITALVFFAGVIGNTVLPISKFIQDISEIAFYIILVIFYQLNASWLKKMCRNIGWPKMVNYIFTFLGALILGLFCTALVWGMLVARGILPEL